ncbi:DUF1802 family protein [Kamptonema formosum]|uniref:DUF1802 family protein n=1 Tax=Kamptonema formosum TaxID=331992 RepID=UPI0003497980|nr:DUF1802 family protein [Oscillatoria sp. PCC 10802]
MSDIGSRALKEWAIAVDALEQGKTVALLRKGGIREEGGRFTVTGTHVWLYPTYEHQQPDLLKPEYAGIVTPVPSGWHPDTIRIGSWAEITDVLPVSDESAVAALLSYHIWNQKFVSDRLKWKRREPLYVLLLRANRLATAQEIPYLPEYGGCRSWIDLAVPVASAESSPVLSDAEYAGRCAEIREAIANTRTISA